MRFWPANEPARLDYERLREMALAGAPIVGPNADRFHRGGLRALITRSTSCAPQHTATLVTVPRPRWSPFSDPRLDSLADAYALLALAVPVPSLTIKDVAR